MTAGLGSGRLQQFRRPARARARDESGTTLVEVIIAVWIMGALFVAMLAALFTMVRTSDANRQRTLGEVELRHFAEYVRDAPYRNCQTPGAPYQAGYTPGDAAATANVTDVQYWVPPSGGGPRDYSLVFAPTCPGTGDTGLQRVTVQVQLGTDAPLVLSTTIVKAKP